MERLNVTVNKSTLLFVSFQTLCGGVYRQKDKTCVPIFVDLTIEQMSYELRLTQSNLM